MLTVLLVSWVLQLAAVLPQGYDQAHWGMTVSQLQAQTKLKKADKGHGYGFAEHMEIDPEVYVSPQADGGRVEYYFFQGKLYKVFVIYSKAKATADKYKQLAADFREKYGKPAQHYGETYFGFQVQHTLWEDPHTVLDLRSGAGFVYEVWLGKDLAQQKKKRKDLKDAV